MNATPNMEFALQGARLTTGSNMWLIIVVIAHPDVKTHVFSFYVFDTYNQITPNTKLANNIFRAQHKLQTRL